MQVIYRQKRHEDRAEQTETMHILH